MLLSRKSNLENGGNARDAVISVVDFLAADGDLTAKSILRDHFNVNGDTPFEGEVVDRFHGARRFVSGDKP